MKHQHPDQSASNTDPAHQNMENAPKATSQPHVEPPAGQKALQHIGHDGHSGPDNPQQHEGGTGMEHNPTDAGAMPPGQMNHDQMDHSKMGHGGHDHGAMIADFLRRFWVCVVLSIPVIALSTMFQTLAGYELDFAGRPWIVIGIASIIYVYGGWPFLTGMIGELRNRQPGMMTLVAIAVTTAYVYSVAVSAGWLRGMDFFWELATLIDIMLLGHYIEMKSVAGASRSLELIVKMLPSEAHKVDGNAIVDVQVDTLNKGDTVLVRPGERIPTDGEVIEGSSAVNESMLTGESVPAQKGAKDSVIAGAVNGEGSLKIRVTHKGADSYLNKVVKMVEEAQTAKSQTQNLADRAAGWLTLLSL